MLAVKFEESSSMVRNIGMAIIPGSSIESIYQIDVDWVSGGGSITEKTHLSMTKKTHWYTWQKRSENTSNLDLFAFDSL